MNPSPPSNKLFGLQVVRAVAATLVVWMHVLFEVQEQGLHAFQDYRGDVKGFGAVGVDLFFVLSGLVVSLSAARRPAPGDFLFRRLLRIFPFYWAAAALFVLATFLNSGGLTRAQLAFMPFLLPNPSKALSLPTYPNSWTLVNELFFYFCLYVGLRVWSERARAVCAGIVLACVLAYVATAGLLHRSLPVLNYYGNPIALEFLFGMAIGVVLKKGTLSRTACYAAIGLGCVALAATIAVGVGELWNPTTIRRSLEVAFLRVFEWGVPSTLIVLGTANLGWSPRSALGRGFVYLGDACYSIYLMQWLPIGYLAGAMRASGHVLGGDLTALLFVIVTVAWGVLVYRFVEKPMTAYLTKALLGRRPRGEPALADAGIAPASLEPEAAKGD